LFTQRFDVLYPAASLGGTHPGFGLFPTRGRAANSVECQSTMRAGPDSGIITTTPIEEVGRRLRARAGMVRNFVSDEPGLFTEFLREIVHVRAQIIGGQTFEGSPLRAIPKGRAFLDRELVERQVIDRHIERSAKFGAPLIKRLPLMRIDQVKADAIEELPRGITYLRIYDLQSGLPKMTESTRSPALIWDFRYLAGNYPQSRELLEVMAEPGAAQLPSLQTVGNFKTPQGDPPEEANEPAQARRPGQPVIVLVNQRTRGPVEAALDALQATGSILTVGTRTAGMTGSYQAAPCTQGFWVIDGEILAAEGASLLGRGLTPEIAVAVTPEADFVGYQLLETGYATADILKLELPSTETGAEPNEEGTLRPSDPILQRAVEIVIALQVLGKLPTSH